MRIMILGTAVSSFTPSSFFLSYLLSRFFSPFFHYFLSFSFFCSLFHLLQLCFTSFLPSLAPPPPPSPSLSLPLSLFSSHFISRFLLLYGRSFVLYQIVARNAGVLRPLQAASNRWVPLALSFVSPSHALLRAW